MKLLLLLAALCAFTAAMVPRDRRAVNTEDEPEATPNTQYCAANTPCGWSLYKTFSKIVEQDISNSYCVCAEGMTCQIAEDDLGASSYIKKCRSAS